MLGCFVGFFLVNEKEVVMVFVGINIVVSILGILGNLFVCIIVCIIWGMVLSFYYFIVSFVVVDLMVVFLD